MKETFKRFEDNILVEIEVVQNAFAYSNRYSWLFSIFIKDNAIDETEFLEMKESLIIALQHQEKAKYVGMRVVDGWYEIYFYASSSKELNNITSKILTSSDYTFESNVVKDSKWDFYRYNLYPTELEEAFIESEKIVDMLKEEGDDLLVPRLVEHYASFQTPTQKDRFVKNMNLDSVSFKDDISSDEFENGIALECIHAIGKNEVKKIIETLFIEIKKENGFYEGWSTTLVDN